MRQLSDAVAANDSWARQLAAGTLRSPHLWGCEALLRRHRLAVAASDATAAAALQDELAAAVGDAFARLCGNFGCVADLRPYLAVLEGPMAQQLAARAHELAAEGNAADEVSGAASSSSAEGASGSSGASSAAAENGREGSNGTADGGSGEAGTQGSTRGVSAQVRRLQRVVNAHALEAELGLPGYRSPADAEAHAARLLSLYADQMHLSGGCRGWWCPLGTWQGWALASGCRRGGKTRCARSSEGCLKRACVSSLDADADSAPPPPPFNHTCSWAG